MRVTWSILSGDCLERLGDLDDDSIDAVVTDPPYGLSAEPDAAEVLRHWLDGDDYRHRGGGFMGKTWDSFVPGPTVWKECLRVLKPGGHLVAFFGTRTVDLGGMAIRLAGFEIRDCLAWHYGSGFPKSLDVSKAIDKAAGAEREVVGTKLGLPGYSLADDQGPGGVAMEGNRDGSLRNAEAECQITAPATDLARQWQGWGTALKPAFEPIILARKPLIGTVAENVTRFGTGALNVDGCRVGLMTEAEVARSGKSTTGMFAEGGLDWKRSGREPQGRWPANLVLDDQAAAMLDEQSGETKSPGNYTRSTSVAGIVYPLGGKEEGSEHFGFGDTGGASRFFYQAKASRAERNAGLDGSPVGCACETFTEWGNADQSQDTRAGSDTRPKRDTTGRNSADDSEWSTTGSGSRKTGDRSRTATTSTTSTETSRTTDPKTSSSSTRSRTNGPTRRTTGATSGASGSVAAESAKNGNRPTANTSTRTGTAGFSTDGADPAISNESSRTRSEGANCPDCGGVIGGGLPTRNAHPLPTVKPIDLMRWLVRLVTPPGGTVLDPFTGSGTTGIAAGLEGFEFVGIEREAEYREIAEARLRWWVQQEGETAEILHRAGLAEKQREKHKAVGQTSLFEVEAA